MSPSIHLPKQPTDQSQQQLSDLFRGMAEQERSVPVNGQLASSQIGAILKDILTVSGDRTLVMLDNGGVNRDDVAAIIRTLASYGTTTVVSVADENPVEYGSAAKNITIAGGPKALLAHIQADRESSPLKGVAGVVCGYHDGAGVDASLYLADHLLMSGGLYVEIFYDYFTQQDVVTLYRREELAAIAKARAARALQSETGASKV